MSHNTAGCNMVSQHRIQHFFADNDDLLHESISPDKEQSGQALSGQALSGQALCRNKLLHGECDSAAALISQKLTEAGIVHHIERMLYSEQTPWAFIHEYVVARDAQDRECCIDIRGVFYKKDEFVRHFLEYESQMDPDFDKGSVCYQVCEDDEYADWMYTIDWIRPEIRELFYMTIDTHPEILNDFLMENREKDEMEKD